MLHSIVLTWLSTAQGGAEKSIAELADALASQGVPTHLIWWPATVEAPAAPVLNEAKVTGVADWDGYRRTVTGLAANQAGTVVISSHRTAAADIVICGTTPVLSVLRGAVPPGRPLRVIAPGTGRIELLLPEQMPGGLLGKARWIGISEAASASARLFPGVKEARTVYNGVPLPPAAPPRTPPTPGILRVAVIARTVPWKRVEDVIYAAADPSLSARIRVTVYGEPGSADASLRELATSIGAPVVFHGYTTELGDRLAEADVLVSPSPEEGFGRCIVDAAGAGVPAIVPDAGAGPEVVLDGLTGIVYPHAVPGALVMALNVAADADPEQLAAMGAAARARALALFNPSRCAAQFLDAAHRLLTATETAPR